MEALFLDGLVFLFIAVIAVPIAKRLGLGSVLGYLLSGFLAGPILGLVSSDTEGLMSFVELGVVMMLFLIGLELRPRSLWDMRSRLLGLGGLQVSLTTVAIALAAKFVMGASWNYAIACGLILALSSTAIVLQTLEEKGLLKSYGGQSSFSVLLFQDIIVIPILALLPLLASPELSSSLSVSGEVPGEVAHHLDFNLVRGLPGWQIALINISAIATVVVGGHYLSRPFFRYIATANLREIFTATALLLVLSITALMSLVGLSPALGTFLAGVVLANSEFRRELESNIEPFKGILLALFFITIGA
ncbi:MAG: potassium transporter, partial [Candidatus Portiera sp.]|nr:potassium transporter [Portiera sp.]